MSRNLSLPACFVPPYLLRQVATTRPELAARCGRTLLVDERLRAARSTPPGPRTLRAELPGEPAWVVHTAGNGTDLPGTVVRSAGDAPSGDPAVDEAATGISGSLALFAEVYDRLSYDGQGAPVSLTVHYGEDYDNAFWDGVQLVFGDGDGELFDRFTKPVDVLGHELTHAVTEHTAGLVYEGQSGALNESVSDVFASCLKQRLLGQTAEEADWLIGAGLFLPGVQARGLRDMAHPGTAYDDPVLGRDPQPDSMAGYVETTEDHGGVHLNSGIPNRAFHLAAVGLGGSSWEGAGRVWYAALTGGAVTTDTDFAGFAAATVAAARDLGDAGEAAAGVVEQAWATVGVVLGAPGGSGVPTPSGGLVGSAGSAGSVGSATRVRVRRTGGFAGRAYDGEVDLEVAADERAAELRGLVDRIDVRGVATGAPQPDRFVYEFDLAGQVVVVAEQHLTDDLRRVADLVLHQDR